MNTIAQARPKFLIQTELGMHVVAPYTISTKEPLVEYDDIDETEVELDFSSFIPFRYKMWAYIHSLQRWIRKNRLIQAYEGNKKKRMEAYSRNRAEAIIDQCIKTKAIKRVRSLSS